MIMSRGHDHRMPALPWPPPEVLAEQLAGRHVRAELRGGDASPFQTTARALVEAARAVSEASRASWRGRQSSQRGLSDWSSSKEVL